MIVLALGLALAAGQPKAVDGLPIGALPKQSLPAKGCAAYLFSAGTTRTLVAMASADPAQLRFVLDGTMLDYARAGETGAGALGFARTTQYRRGDVTVTLDMTVTTRADLANGGIAQEGTLRVDRPGKDSVVLPVGGIIGCA